MSLKAKLATTLAALCMVICLLTVGVWAASQGTVTLHGTVNFVASDVNVKIEGETSGTNGYQALAKTTIAEWDASADYDTAEETWEPAITFTNKNQVITVTITVTNNSTERKVDAVFAPTLNDTAITATEEAAPVGDTNIKAYYTTKAQIAEGGNATYTVVMSIVDANKTVKDVVLGGTLILENAEA